MKKLKENRSANRKLNCVFDFFIITIYSSECMPDACEIYTIDIRHVMPDYTMPRYAITVYRKKTIQSGLT